MSIVRWNPWREFDDFFTNVAAVPSEHLARSEWLPPVDISETETEYRIDVEIPAVARDDVTVAVKDGVLTVTGERKVMFTGAGELPYDDIVVFLDELRGFGVESIGIR